MRDADWMEFESKLNKVIDEIINLPFEKNLLFSYFERFRKENGIEFYKELDDVVFKKMYGRPPKGAQSLKIRYWRCGNHLPKSREEMICLGKVLGLSDKELNQVLKEVLLETGLEDSSNQKKILNLLAKRYLALISKERKEELGLSGFNLDSYLRHILYADIMDCIWSPDMNQKWYRMNHDYSRNFASECTRFFYSSEKISRSTVQRLLVVMLMPEINVVVMDSILKKMGYAPMDFHIRKRSGAYADRLYIWILEQFEIYRTGDLKEDLLNQKKMLRMLDKEVVRYLTELEKMNPSSEKERRRKLLQDLRLMKFRSFGKESG